MMLVPFYVMVIAVLATIIAGTVFSILAYQIGKERGEDEGFQKGVHLSEEFYKLKEERKWHHG